MNNVTLRYALDRIRAADRRVKLHIRKADHSEVCHFNATRVYFFLVELSKIVLTKVVTLDGPHDTISSIKSKRQASQTKKTTRTKAIDLAET